MLQFLTFMWSSNKHTMNKRQGELTRGRDKTIDMNSPSAQKRKKDLNHSLIKFISETCFFVYAYVFYFCYRWIIGVKRRKTCRLGQKNIKKKEQKSKSRTNSASIFLFIPLDVIVSILRRLEFI